MANIEKYEGYPITFEKKNEKMMVNATQMGKAFGHGKEPNYWLKTQAAKDFNNALSKARNLASSDLQQVTYGDGKEPTIGSKPKQLRTSSQSFQNQEILIRLICNKLCFR